MLRTVNLWILICLVSAIHAQSGNYEFLVNWNNPVVVTDSLGRAEYFPDFDKIQFGSREKCPYWMGTLPSETINRSFAVVDLKTESLNALEYAAISSFLNDIPDSLFFETIISYTKKVPLQFLRLIPYIKDAGGEIKKVVYVNFELKESTSSIVKQSQARVYAENSVLSSGNWCKFGATAEGIYIITYQNLIQSGISPAGINPRHIALFGNGGAMLPESNTQSYYDDLMQNAIEVVGEDDGSFDQNDYILFYHNGMDLWKYSATGKQWEHSRNIYADTAWYFLTILNSDAKRVELKSNTVPSGGINVDQYDFVTLHELDQNNLLKSGKLWLGEVFDLTNELELDFSIPEPVADARTTLKVATVARSENYSTFSLKLGNNTWTIDHDPVTYYYTNIYADNNTSNKTITNNLQNIALRITYNKPDASSIGWLDYVELNSKSKLKFTGGQSIMRFPQPAESGSIIQSFNVAGNAASVKVWDVTDQLNLFQIKTVSQANGFSFADTCSNEAKKYIIHNGTGYFNSIVGGVVTNQNLHSLRNIDMVILSPAIFGTEAQRLAVYHAEHDGLTVKVLSPENIYNEFSSGKPDPVAIRNFMKMLYDRADATNLPKYLLLFGDGSYDNKFRIKNNKNFIITYQTLNSLDPVSSAVYDDFFGLLDDNEGVSVHDQVDIGIGRLPVQSAEEAAYMVDKIIRYQSTDYGVQGDWRNVITYIADDEDDNDHIYDSEQLATMFLSDDPSVNVDKIYLDAYIQESQSAGDRYPAVNDAINQRIDKGSLLVNYIGHAGETGLAHEKVLQVNDINSWTNKDNMPLFVTATCEFSRFDDPERISAGEFVCVNPFGGGIALLTTTRPTYGQPNFSLNKSIMNHLFFDTDASSNRLGDIMMKAKQDAVSGENGRKFVLLGDPAIKLTIPVLNIKTTAINGRAISDTPDTLRALEEITVQGEITDKNGNPVNDFSGTILPTVFDKATQQITLANDGGSPYSFMLQKNVIYKGTEKVVNGKFSFTFIVPGDIAYQYGKGKISYYAYSNETDASGYYSDICIGGISENAITDTEGPLVELFINDTLFRDGSISGENPILIAHVSDENGINTIGSGIGHDITAILDGETTNPYILNGFYTADINTYKKGKVVFPIHKLSNGEHTLNFKVWDLLNNSTEATIHFRVYQSTSMVVDNVRNFPNPFSGSTNILFDQNQRGTELDVKVDIYSFAGILVKRIETTVYQEGTSSVPVEWNGKDLSGNLLPSGIYLYSVSIASRKGGFAQKTGKMIYSR